MASNNSAVNACEVCYGLLEGSGRSLACTCWLISLNSCSLHSCIQSTSISSGRGGGDVSDGGLFLLSTINLSLVFIRSPVFSSCSRTLAQA